jgi:drug/metabolite transporter superfamily protein YnfA
MLVKFVCSLKPGFDHTEFFGYLLGATFVSGVFIVLSVITMALIDKIKLSLQKYKL